MDIQDEINYSRLLIDEARKVNPQLGNFVKLLGPPLSEDITVQLTNGTAEINFMILQEFKRSRKNTPKEFIEEVAWSFKPKVSSSE